MRGVNDDINESAHRARELHSILCSVRKKLGKATENYNVALTKTVLAPIRASIPEEFARIAKSRVCKRRMIKAVKNCEYRSANRIDYGSGSKGPHFIPYQAMLIHDPRRLALLTVFQSRDRGSGTRVPRDAAH